MKANPYETPSELIEQDPRSSSTRTAAQRHVRMALLIMLLPAAYNFVCFNFSPSFDQIEFPNRSLYRMANLIGFGLIAAAVWWFGLTLFEFVTRGIHSIVARKSKLAEWQRELYSNLQRAPGLAIPGAVLWAVWVLAFYQLQIKFYLVSVPVAIAAHLLAAWLYLPLAYQWFQIERHARQNST